jgi:osmotically-inducible protein OsmY
MNSISKMLKNNKAVLLVVGFVAVLNLFSGSSASAQSLRARVVSNNAPAAAVVKTEKKNDLSYEVRYRLLTMQGYTVFDWLEARTNANGEVTLRGQATSAALKAKAEQMVASIGDVTKINNQIEVLPASDVDMNLRKQLYRAVYNQNTALSRYAMVTAPTIHIVVKNGSVDLRGNVDSSNDSDMAFVAANAVPKVSKVMNNLSINNAMVASVASRNR